MSDKLMMVGALLALASMVWFGVSILRLLPSSSRKSALGGLKYSALSFIVALAMLFVGGVTNSTPPTQVGSQVASVSNIAVAEPSKEDKAAEYIERITSETKSIPSFKAKEYGKDIETIAIGVALLNAWATIYDDGASLNLSKEQETVRQTYKKAISKKQAEALPILRDLYGPAMRKQLWEVDGKAKTFGNKFKTIEIISGAFAANRNIKSTHETLHPTLSMLRFTRAQYKWLDANVEYSYYTMETPSDTDLVRWNKNGSHVKID